jgi:medium-chain acyl-[acyl-carrier-protein] hydrolase
LYQIKERIGASRTDMYSRLKLSSALDLIQDCSYHWMESEPDFLAYLHRHGIVMVLVSRQVDIARLPEYGENVSVRTSIFERRSFLGQRNTVLYGEDGLPCVLTWSTGAFVESGTGKMARLPPEIVGAITLDEKVHMEYLNKKIALPETGWRRLETVPVRRNDIDLNGHMNNARYVEAALELLPDEREIGRLRIEYKLPARPGGILYPQYAEGAGGKRFLVLADEHGRPYPVMEFS